jgi:hypothetical protein
MVRLQAGLRLDTTMFGKIAAPRRKTSAAMVAQEDRKAYPGSSL